jgi:ADP-heptose:LPS heptosyltransferase
MNYPESSITLVASPTNYPINFSQINPFIDNVIYYDKSSVKTIYQFYKKLWQKKYQLGIVPSTVKISTTSHIINFLSGAKLRVGVKSIDNVNNPAAILLNVKSDFYWAGNKVHQTGRNLDIARLAGCEVVENNEKERLTYSKEDLDFAQSFVEKHFPDNKKMIIGFHPGAGESMNIWDTNNYIKLIKVLYKKYNNYVLITCGEIDKKIIEMVKESLSGGKIEFTVAENMPLLQLAAILKKINLYISNDTGPMHIAGMTNVKQISLMQSYKEFEWAPAGENKYSLKSEPGNINTIKFEDVLDLCIKLLAG